MGIAECLKSNTTEEDIKAFVCAAVNALDCFHRDGFIHGDYQWQNLVTKGCKRETVKMVDFDFSEKPDNEKFNWLAYRDYAILIGFDEMIAGSGEFGETAKGKQIIQQARNTITTITNVTPAKVEQQHVTRELVFAIRDILKNLTSCAPS